VQRSKGASLLRVLRFIKLLIAKLSRLPFQWHFAASMPETLSMRAMNRRFVGIAIAASFIGMTMTSAWADSCPPQCASGKVPLGLAVPMSGPVAVFGRQTAKAVELAVSEVNAAGGLLGVPVELVIGDDRCDAGMTVEVTARHIKQDKINFLIGPICPDVALDATPIYAKAGVIQIVPTVTITDLTRRNFDSVFRIAATDEQEAQALGAYFTKEQSRKKLTIVYGNYFYRRTMAELASLALPAEVKASTRFEPLSQVPGAADRLAEKLQRDPQDVIYITLDTAQAVEFIGKLRARGVKTLVMGGQHLLSQGFWRAIGPRPESINVIAPIESLSKPEFRDAVDSLKQSGVVPDLVALYSYVAVQIWAEAVRRAGNGDSKKIAEMLRSGEFTTAVGRVTFDQKGDRRDISYSVLTWQGGPLPELRVAQQVAIAATPGTIPPSIAGQSTALPPESILYFDQPVPFGPVPVNGKTIKQLADGIPLFPPIEGQDEALWKKNCSACHKWDRETLCQQGARYLADPNTVLRLQHPYGGPFKVALMRWSRSGCL
jgi:branched-chain amino acid transport system substrate-binding protein